jgi:hypothetical protein
MSGFGGTGLRGSTSLCLCVCVCGGGLCVWGVCVWGCVCGLCVCGVCVCGGGGPDREQLTALLPAAKAWSYNLDTRPTQSFLAQAGRHFGYQVLQIEDG